MANRVAAVDIYLDERPRVKEWFPEHIPGMLTTLTLIILTLPIPYHNISYHIVAYIVTVHI
jgi:hypothetical protein